MGREKLRQVSTKAQQTYGVCVTLVKTWLTISINEYDPNNSHATLMDNGPNEFAETIDDAQVASALNTLQESFATQNTLLNMAYHRAVQTNGKDSLVAKSALNLVKENLHLDTLGETIRPAVDAAAMPMKEALLFINRFSRERVCGFLLGIDKAEHAVGIIGKPLSPNARGTSVLYFFYDPNAGDIWIADTDYDLGILITTTLSSLSQPTEPEAHTCYLGIYYLA
jgi:hypothetical protein